MCDFWSGFRDFALAVAALWTAWVAERGVDAWKKELHGKVGFDLARSLLTSLSKIRTEISRVRYAEVQPHEYSSFVEREGESESEKFKRRQLGAYANRIRPVNEEKMNLISSMEQAEALWGIDIREPVEKLGDHINDLIRTISKRYDSEYPSSGQDLVHDLNVMYLQDKDTDEYAKELGRRIEAIAKLIRPHL